MQKRVSNFCCIILYFQLQVKVLLDYIQPQMIDSINNGLTNKCVKRLQFSACIKKFPIFPERMNSFVC